MKIATWIFAAALLIAFASAGVIPQEEEEQYLPPVGQGEQPGEDAAVLAEDGYRYKTVRKLRHRRDVSELVESAVLSDDGYHYRTPEVEEPLPKASNEYLPPNEEATNVKKFSEAPQISEEYLPPVEEVAKIKEAPIVTEAPIVLDVPQPSEVSNEYLPPVEESVGDAEVVEAPQESAVLAKDGYRYRTIRYRRDVSEIVAPSSGYLYVAPADTKKAASVYLPPVEAKEAVDEPTEAPQVPNEYLPPAEVKEAVPQPTEAPQVANEYLPPVAEVKEASEVVEAPVDSADLAEDGYRYKTIRKLKYRHRRDVSEIVAPSSGYLYEAPADTKKAASVYLPPVRAKEAVEEPTEAPQVPNEYLPPAEVKEAVPEPSEAPQVANVYLPPAEVKEVVSEPTDGPQVTNEYLPPVAEVKEAAEVIEAPAEIANGYLPPVSEVQEAPEAPADTTVLAKDGYSYKTIRRLKYRHRRDVSEIFAPESAVLVDDGYHYKVPEELVVVPEVSNEYLPPAELKEAPEATNEAPAATEAPIVTEAPVTTEVPVITEAPIITEAPVFIEAPKVSNEYLPPSEELPDLKEASEVPETAVLADDGYHYKANEDFRLRRDVSEVVAPTSGYLYEPPAPTDEAANIYLPPVEAKEAAEPSEAPQVSNEYLPPVEETIDDAEGVEAPQESAVLADDGYHYKTVRRLTYRHRRDLSEITDPNSAANGYFYPSSAKQAVDTPAENTAVLADDGYRYKTVRRIRYRYRRDVSDIVNSAAKGYVYEAPAASEPVAKEYIPPVEQLPEVKNIEAEPVANEYLPPVEQLPGVKAVEAEPTEAAPAPEVSNEYLPPAEETRGDAEIVEAPEDSAVLADEGYHYRTIRRIR